MARRLTERQAAAIEARIELAKYSTHRDGPADAGWMLRDYWDRCGLSPDVRAQLEASNRYWLDEADRRGR